MTLYLTSFILCSFILSSSRLLNSSKVQRATIVDLPPKPRRLVELPQEYMQLIDRAAQFKCPNNSMGDCNSPALCLVCDTIVCSQVNNNFKLLIKAYRV